MGIVIQSVANYAPWLYAICGLVALYQLYRIWLVRAERKQAVFSLEREKASRDTYNILAIALIVLMIMGATYFTSNVLADALDPLVQAALVPDPGLPFVPTPPNTPLAVTATPTWTPSPLGATGTLSELLGLGTVTPDPDGTPDPDATLDPNDPSNPDEPDNSEAAPPEVVATSTPVPTPAPVVVAPSCPDSRSLLIRPGENEVVSGVVNIIGTATHESFQYYKVEYAPGASASGGFVYVGGQSSPVVNSFLASLDTNGLSNGAWTVQLIVVDQTGNFPPPCKVSITVQN